MSDHMGDSWTAWEISRLERSRKLQAADHLLRSSPRPQGARRRLSLLRAALPRRQRATPAHGSGPAPETPSAARNA